MISFFFRFSFRFLLFFCRIFIGRAFDGVVVSIVGMNYNAKYFNHHFQPMQQKKIKLTC